MPPDADAPVDVRSTRPLPLPANLEGSSTQQQGSLEDRSSDGSLDIASIPPPVLAQDDSLEGVGEADAEEVLARPRPQPPPPPRTLSRISEGSFSRQMGSSGEDKHLAAVQSRFLMLLVQPCTQGKSLSVTLLEILVSLATTLSLLAA